MKYSWISPGEIILKTPPIKGFKNYGNHNHKIERTIQILQD